MNEREIEFIKAAVLGELYWKTRKGPKLTVKLKTRFQEFKLEDYQDYVDHVKNLIRDPIRTAGFGGWNKDITEEDVKNYKKNEIYEEFSEVCRQGKINFVTWYLTKAHVAGKKSKCCYCGVTEEESEMLLPKHAKRDGTRGEYLEIERLDTAPGHNIYKDTNCALACYVCNNAKSNIFTVQEFKPIACEINKWWNEKLKNSNLKDKYPKIAFPTDIWSKKFK